MTDDDTARLNRAYVDDLFQALTPDDVWDVTTKDREWIIIHVHAPDSDATHYALWVNMLEPTWKLYDRDHNELVYRQPPDYTEDDA